MPEAAGPSGDLVRRAQAEGHLSVRSAAALMRPEVARGVDLALRNSWQLTKPGHSLLVTLMPDDSGSMAGFKQSAVIQGHNDLIEAMFESPASKRTLFQTRYLNGRVLNPFRPLEYCEDLTAKNYQCVHGTPLYAETLILLGSVVAKTEELDSQGARSVNSATLLMTDAETSEVNAGTLLPEIRSVITDMRRVGNHIVAGMGFGLSGSDSRHGQLFQAMGIDSKYIFSAASRQEILEKFGMFTSYLGISSGQSTS